MTIFNSVKLWEVSIRKSAKDVRITWITPMIVILTFVGFSLIIHGYLFWSPFVLPEATWLKKLELHLTWYPFAVRPLQSYATLFLHKVLGLPIRESFFIIQYLLMTALGFAFYRLLILLNFSRKWSIVGLVMLFTAYPIAGAHFAPTHTWDDFWCYLSLVLMIIALIKDKPIVVGISFLVALVAREQAAIFLVLLLAWYNPVHGKSNRIRFLSTAIVPFLIFVSYRLFIWENPDPTRWKLVLFNFADVLKTNDSIVSLVISFGLLWTLFFAGLFVKRNVENNKSMQTIRTVAPIILLVNVFVTLLFSFARETRIFFPPFVVVIPIALLAVQAAFDSHRTRLRWLMTSALVVIGIGLAISGFFAADYLFPKFDYQANSELRRPLAGVHLGLILAVLVYWASDEIKSRITRARRLSDDS